MSFQIEPYLDSAIKFFDFVAPLTPTAWDDRVNIVLKFIRQSESLRNIIEWAVDRSLSDIKEKEAKTGQVSDAIKDCPGLGHCTRDEAIQLTHAASCILSALHSARIKK